MEFFFSLPTTAFVGPGKAKATGDILTGMGAKKVMVIYDQGVKAAGIVDGILASIKDAGIAYTEYSEVLPNPPDYLVEKGLAIATDFGADALVAIGGGSSIDYAKAVNILLTNPPPFSKYDGVNLVQNPVKPLIAIPTTAGTASEVTGACVITDTVRKKKMVALGQNVGASIALIDPLLTVGLPPAITAATGMDALTHAVESYVSKWASVVSESLALTAVELISANLEKAVDNGQNIEARTNMIIGSMVAGMAFTNTDLGMSHAIAHPLGAHCNLAHGVANAIALPFVMEYNLEVVPGKMKNIAKAMGLDVDTLSDRDAGLKAIARVREISKNIKIPTLSEAGVSREMFDILAEAALAEGAAITNPREITKEAVFSVLERAY